jgi:hypothetical protein
MKIPHILLLRDSVPELVCTLWKILGKAIPLQAWTGPQGFRSLKLPDFKTIGT